MLVFQNWKNFQTVLDYPIFLRVIYMDPKGGSRIAATAVNYYHKELHLGWSP